MKTFSGSCTRAGTNFRAGREKRYEELFSPLSLFIAGLFVIPALLFNPGVFWRVVQFAGFWFLCWLAGKKNNPLITIAFFAGIALFNLAVPYGRVLFSIGGFNITSGALAGGVKRAATVEGLIMISRVSVRKDLSIPGFFGELSGESLRLFSVMMNSKSVLQGKNLFEGIDALLLALSEREIPPPQKAGKTKPAGMVALVGIVICAWLPLLAAVIPQPR